MKYLVLTCLLFLLATTLHAQCIDGNCETGIGMFKTPNGSIYEGQFKGGLPHGNGRLVKVSGDIYEGQFKYGVFDGLGTLFGADSTVYRGAFRQGVKQGKGELTYANGKKLSAVFQNNAPAGDKSSHPENLNFYTCDLGVQYGLPAGFFTIIDVINNFAYIDTLSFDLKTGKLIPGQRAPKTQIGELSYDLTPGYSPKYQTLYKRNDEYTSRMLHYIGKDYLIMSGHKYNKGDVAVFKVSIPSKKTEKISIFKGIYYSDVYPDYLVSPDAKRLFKPKSGEIFLEEGKKVVKIKEMNLPGYQYFDWFSDNSDTLYRFRDDFSIQAYNSATGDWIKTTTYTSNRLDLNSQKRYKVIYFSPKDKCLIILFDPYEIAQFHAYEKTYRKAAVFFLTDPDYMLPLVNPFYTKEFYALKSEKELKRVSDLRQLELDRLAEARKKYGGANPASSKITSILEDENDKAYKKSSTVKKGSSSAGVCIWCGGSGKVTSKDVYDKGYNTTYTSNGSRATLRSVGGSTTTSVCMACHGTGH